MANRSPIQNALEAAVVRTLLAAMHAGGEGIGIARGAFGLVDHLIPRLRRVAMRNLEMALPELPLEKRIAIADGCYRSLARVISTVAHFPDINASNVSSYIRYDGFAHFEAAKRAGKGILFATAHLGNWELSAFAHALMAEPMSFVVRPLDNPKLEELAFRYRTMSGNTVLGRGKDFLRPLVETLRRNEAVGILIDQNVTADRGVFVDFFGMKACVDAGFAKLAARTEAAVIPGYALWSEAERKYILRFDAPVEMTGDAQADTQRVHSALEAAIRANPDQWLWIHRRWKTRPPGEPGLYEGV